MTPEEHAEVVKDYGTFSLRQLARQYGVSHETIRQAVARGEERKLMTKGL